MATDEWITILNQVKNGEISAEEAAQRLEALEPKEKSISAGPSEEIPTGNVSSQDPLENLGWWRHAWLIPLWIGIFVLILSAWLLSWGFSNERFFWFYCSWIPLILGMLILLVGVWSRQARWVHVRIRETGGPKISISLPVPTRMAGWVLKIISPFIPESKREQLDRLPELLNALGDMRDPITVEVNEKDGERVRIYIQ